MSTTPTAALKLCRDALTKMLKEYPCPVEWIETVRQLLKDTANTAPALATHDDAGLPELPKPVAIGWKGAGMSQLADGYTADQMRAYARAALDNQAAKLPLTFFTRGGKMGFSVGVQNFLLDCEPEDEAHFKFISDMLTKALNRAALDKAGDADHVNGVVEKVAQASADDARDAARYRWLRDQKPNALHLSRNGDHACNYVTAKQWIEEHVPEDFADDDPVQVELMKNTNTIWSLQIYPDTPIGFNRWNAATLDDVIDAGIAALQRKEG